MSLENLIEISREYGADEEFVLAGGGNTSWKEDGSMYVKASGTSLADITEAGFVKMDLVRLARIWKTEYPKDADERESAALRDLMESRAPGEENRPSVETLLHALFLQSYVVHTHPALVNGLTCSRDGEAVMQELFGDAALWVPLVNPGYILAREVKARIKARIMSGGDHPDIVFLQNHGVFVARDDLDGIRDTYRWIMETLEARTARKPDFGPPEESSLTETGQALCETVAAGIAGVSAGSGTVGVVDCAFVTNRDLIRLLASPDAFEPISSAYTPDHIVYAGPKPLYLDSIPESPDDVSAAAAVSADGGPIPKIVAVKDVGVFACGPSSENAATAARLFLDAVKVAVFAEAFGGHRFMTPEHIEFIVNWEVERYRAKQLKEKQG